LLSPRSWITGLPLFAFAIEQTYRAMGKRVNRLTQYCVLSLFPGPDRTLWEVVLDFRSKNTKAATAFFKASRSRAGRYYNCGEVPKFLLLINRDIFYSYLFFKEEE